MRAMKAGAVLAIFVIGVSVLLNAGQNKFGVADEQRAIFSHAIRVGDTVLSKGEYKIEHTMEGTDHIMVFTQLKTSKPATARAKCQLVPVEPKVQATYFSYLKSTAADYVLQEMAFKGDLAKHVF
jgi:hypothetical protein